ncbi:MAG: phosphatase PAP2 family protein [Clostridia bacterium]|nr:phosphatase PAP2 family protein [Clostridia bacterium]
MKSKIKELLIKNIKWIIVAVVLLIFIMITEDVFEKEIMKMDIIAYESIVENFRNDALTNVMKFITNLGGAYVLIIASILSLIVTIIVKRKSIGIVICSNLAVSFILNIILKNIVQRPRPEGYRLVVENGYSFPSGHSMVSVAFYGFIIYLIFNYVENKYIKYILCGLFSLLVLVILFSRVYLGVHYASDVISGFLISIAYLICFITVFNSIKEKKDINY